MRPEVQFGDVLRQRIEQQKTSTLSEEEQLKQANALYSLLDNRYKKKVRNHPLMGYGRAIAGKKRVLRAGRVVPVQLMIESNSAVPHHQLHATTEEQSDVLYRLDTGA